MNITTLDEDSSRVSLGSLESSSRGNKQDHKIGLLRAFLNQTKEYFFSIYQYIIEKFFVGKHIFERYGKQMAMVAGAVKSYFIIKMFWGRGSLYRYIVLLAIFTPILISLIFIEFSNRIQVTPQKNLILSNSFISDTRANANNSTVQGQLVESNIPEQSQQLISWYRVVKGDTLDSIGKKFGISPDVIMWANNMSDKNIIPGQEIKIIIIQGIVHQVTKTDTIATLTKTYDVSQAQLISWNLNVDPMKPLEVGKNILIPGVTQAQLAMQNTTAPVYNFPVINSSPSAGCPAADSWCYLQGDARWGSMILGGRGSRNTYSWMNVKQIGCLITDVAMVADRYFPQKHITPATIAYNPNNFVGSGLFNLNGLGLMSVTPLGGIFGSVNWTSIDQQIALGHPVIVGMPGVDHYVVLYAKEDGHYIMNDSAYGGALVFDKYYSPRYVEQAYLYLPN